MRSRCAKSPEKVEESPTFVHQSKKEKAAEATKLEGTKKWTTTAWKNKWDTEEGDDEDDEDYDDDGSNSGRRRTRLLLAMSQRGRRQPRRRRRR